MEAFFTLVILITINYAYSATLPSESSSGNSSLNGTIVVAIVVPTFVGAVVFIWMYAYCVEKCSKNRRMNVYPLSTKIALAEQNEIHAPPSYNEVPPYVQPPPYEPPPPYAMSSSTSMEATNNVVNS
ncbi:unnamed protein product [Rotaria socialis]|uniref:Uncharacterized protein n=1 Tax=Rotaria socialis TaxID=392032 RepID=A0A820VIG1_9BILA|nr:unnamed protein product [Rotaria socialis]CAF3205988.1 unnamed protein product [Rotaria socialis]CAF4475735.1 unnamed protein product [Rotaria socialis]CAF4500594.1 unnamed protein product [Rotaria socialis]